ncbi:MAG: hypothetical protein M3350_02255 [Actinomycetota bacterium]|nr:hypothetical protein [Actinomycetota bacterium]MDQ3719595.1 hypothetical protein [Actinomycetota bacterium]
MTSATLAPRRLFEPAGADQTMELEAGVPETLASRHPGGGVTLEESLSRVWEGLHADGVADCPVCRGRMERGPGDGHCVDCGSSLS